MKIVGGRKFSLHKVDRSMVKRRLPSTPGSSEAERRLETERGRYGKLGAASPVRQIDPVTGKIIAVVPAHE